MTSLSDMELFVHAAVLGSLTRAAIKLDLTQSAASRRIAALEERLGGRLFHRTGRGVRLTELGFSVLPGIKGLLAEAERVVADARAHAGQPVGNVTLGVLTSISKPLVSMLYREGKERFPAIRLEIKEGSGGVLDDAIANGTVDLAILNRYGSAPPEDEELIAHVDMYLVGPCGDRLTRKPSVPFKDLAGLPLLLPSTPNTWRGILEKAARRQGVALNEAMVIDSVSLLLDVVRAGGCYAIVPGHSVVHEVATGKLQASRIVRPAISRMLMLSITSQRPTTIATREVARMVRRILPALVGPRGPSR